MNYLVKWIGIYNKNEILIELSVENEMEKVDKKQVVN